MERQPTFNPSNLEGKPQRVGAKFAKTREVTLHGDEVKIEIPPITMGMPAVDITLDPNGAEGGRRLKLVDMRESFYRTGAGPKYLCLIDLARISPTDLEKNPAETLLLADRSAKDHRDYAGYVGIPLGATIFLGRGAKPQQNKEGINLTDDLRVTRFMTEIGGRGETIVTKAHLTISLNENVTQVIIKDSSTNGTEVVWKE